jgi:transposase-like protein
MATDTSVKGYYPKVRCMMRKRKRYKKEFKLDAVRLVT